MSDNHIILIIVLEILLGGVIIYYLIKLDRAVLALSKEVISLREEIVKILEQSKNGVESVLKAFKSPGLSLKNYKLIFNVASMFMGGRGKLYKILLFLFKTAGDMEKLKK